MDKTKEDAFSAFTAKAIQRIKDKRTRKYARLHVPSLDEEIKIRNLDYPEFTECVKLEDNGDDSRSDKYAIYLAVVEPDLKAVAQEMKDQGLIREYLEAVEVFDPHEISEIAREIMKLSGITSDKKVTVIDELKN